MERAGDGAGEGVRRAIERHARADRFVRWLLFHYVFGCIIALQLLFVTEVLAPMPVAPATKVLFATLLVPFGIIGLGGVQRWRATR